LRFFFINVVFVNFSAFLLKSGYFYFDFYMFLHNLIFAGKLLFCIFAVFTIEKTIIHSKITINIKSIKSRREQHEL